MVCVLGGRATIAVAVGRVMHTDTPRAHFDLDWQHHTEIDPAMLRPSDILVSRANLERTKRELGWSASLDVDAVVTRMCQDEA